MASSPERDLTQRDFDPDEVAQIMAAAYRCWDEIALDCINSIAEDSKGRRSTMTRAHVIEVALDASRIEDHLPKYLAEKFRRLSYAGQKKMVRPAFPYEWYGL